MNASEYTRDHLTSKLPRALKWALDPSFLELHDSCLAWVWSRSRPQPTQTHTFEKLKTFVYMFQNQQCADKGPWTVFKTRKIITVVTRKKEFVARKWQPDITEKLDNDRLTFSSSSDKATTKISFCEKEVWQMDLRKKEWGCYRNRPYTFPTFETMWFAVIKLPIVFLWTSLHDLKAGPGFVGG